LGIGINTSSPLPTLTFAHYWLVSSVKTMMVQNDL
jgi:hypothetical protein